ncbi:glycosyltransferase, group 2 family protein [Bacteroidales bacterium KA00251]|nr:glycosyltransferase, group 2 family protein [Bacteroidales bacterium KA00251]
MYPTVSVIIPAYNEENFIEDCLQSVYQQDYPKELLEVIVVDGNSQDQTTKIIQEKFPQVKLLHNPRKIVPVSMNIGIKEAKSDYIIRLDVHCIYPNNYFSRLIQFMESHSDVDNVGGVCNTLAANNTSKAQAIAIALSSQFGMGNSEFRVGTKEIKEVDTVPFGCYRREVFDKIGGYDEDLIRNQDNELNSRLKQHGGRIILLPDLGIDYYARSSVRKCGRMFYQYGLFNPLVDKKLGQFTSLRRMVPLFFVLYLILFVVLSIILPKLTLWFAIPLLLYLLIDIVASLQHIAKPKVALWLLCIYPVIHINYGIGYLDGILRLLFKRSFVAEANR